MNRIPNRVVQIRRNPRRGMGERTRHYTKTGKLFLYGEGKVVKMVPRSALLTTDIAFRAVEGTRNECEADVRLGGNARLSGTS